MELYQLSQDVRADLLQLISSPTLSIAASQAGRVAQLQAMLANMQPSTALEDERRANEQALDMAIEEREAARELAVSLEQEVARLQSELRAALANVRALARVNAEDAPDEPLASHEQGD